ncbi:uncharacterized protein [Vicugna pacos]|uniref:Uncharacterized protein isoform X1 n=1 Tax=Vicugna pacos TaxID=30538 RepID=A0ABM5E9G9_VICPA
MGPRRPHFSRAPDAGIRGQRGPSGSEQGHAQAGGWGPSRVTPYRRPQAPEITQALLPNRQKKQLRPSCHSNQCPDSGARLVATAGEGAGRNRATEGQQCSRPAPRQQSCGLELLPAAPAPWAGVAGSCFCGEGRERGWSWAAAPGTMPPPIPRLPGHRKGLLSARHLAPPYLWAQCAAPSTSPDPLHHATDAIGHRASPAAGRTVSDEQPRVPPGHGRGDRVLRGTLRGSPVVQDREAGAGRRGAARSDARCGTREVGPGRALRPRGPGAVRPCEELREMASLCSLPFRRVKERIIRNSGLRPRACAAVGTTAQRWPRPGGRVPPARAEQPTSAPKPRSGSSRLLGTALPRLWTCPPPSESRAPLCPRSRRGAEMGASV